MNILIVGCGLLGRKIAELLDAEGHAVAVLDESGDRLSLLNPDFGGVASRGFPMDVQALRGAGIEGCDAVAVVTADDNLNISVGQIAKNFFHVSRVIARISDPKREGIFEDFGLQTMCPTNMSADKLLSLLTGVEESRHLTFGINTVSLTVRPVERRFFGDTTDDLDLEPGETVFGVLRADQRFSLLERGQALPLNPGDSVVYGKKVD